MRSDDSAIEKAAAGPGRRFSLSWRRLLLLDGLDLEGHVDGVTHEKSARLEGHIPLGPEIVAIEGGGGAETGDIGSEWRGAAPIVRDVQGDFLRHAPNGQVTDQVEGAVVLVLDAGAAEGDGGIVLHIQEIGRAEMGVALLGARVDRRGIDLNIHTSLINLIVDRLDRSGDAGKSTL